MNLYRWFMMVCMVGLLLAGCTPTYQTLYHYNPPTMEEGLRCIDLCKQVKAQCQQSCHDLCQNTQADEHLKTSIDTLQCPSPSCQCKADYRACYKLCGGHITEEKICMANCPS